jgi:hypothetical protein
MRHLALIVPLACATAAACGAARAQKFEAGLDAFNAGNYADAYANWWPLALRGDARSQASLGSIGSQIIDNLNASIHVRALLTDLFLIDEALESSGPP